MCGYMVHQTQVPIHNSPSYTIKFTNNHIFIILDKSGDARRLAKGSYYLKDETKFWDLYDYEDTVIIEDMTPDIAKDLERLLMQWTDRYVVKVQIKGGRITVRPKTFIISSAFTIAECFSPWVIDAMSKRFSRVRSIASVASSYNYDPSTGGFINKSGTGSGTGSGTVPGTDLNDGK